jgi:2-dehydro-3-deoxyphosphogluconate aldolase/(4S)-4-hydroxy-2-oxoglutarate aldolase
MTKEIEARLREAPVVPLVQSDDPEVAILTTKALVAGGLTVIEVVMRTDGALVCLEKIAKSVPEAIVGAGTVLSSEQAEAAIAAGAQFIVSPGLYPPVVEVARVAGRMMLPGVSTATEAQQAWNLGLRTLKFFPASLVGGPAMLKALSSVFRDVKFMPTGGVSVSNLPDYLAVPAVLACGGSWLTPAKDIAAGNYDSITGLAREAVSIANKARAQQ